MTRGLMLTLLAVLALAAPGSAQDLVEEGRRAFMRNGCHGCHTVGAMGTPVATDLTHVGAKYRPEYLRRWLRDHPDVAGTVTIDWHARPPGV